MNEVLKILCNHNVNVMNVGLPFPSTIISELCGMTLYKTRKELKRLKEEGLVTSQIYCEKTDDGNFLLRGYIITEKAKDTEEYKWAWEEQRKIFKSVYNVDIGEYTGGWPLT